MALYDQILLLGDSITEWADDQTQSFSWAPAVRTDYKRRLEVINRGFSGYNTEMILRFLDKMIPPVSHGRIRLMTIFLGANDSCFPLTEKNQCVELPVFQKNLIKIVQHPKIVAHNPQIIFITPPPIDEMRQFAVDQEKGYPRRRTAENTKRYADTVRHVANDLGFPVLDLWSKIMELAGWEEGKPLEGSETLPPNPKLLELLTDGLHLSGAGYRVLYDEFVKVVAEKLPHLTPTDHNLPYKLPEWGELC